MNILKIFFVIVVLSSFNPFLNNLDESIVLDSCLSNQSDLTIFEPRIVVDSVDFLFAHGGGLNKCGCHFNRKTNECHCHRNKGCGCECQPSSCS